MAMDLLNWLDNLDKQLFKFIHSTAAWPPLDNAMLFLRNPLVWLPLYMAVFVFIFIKNPKKAGLFILLTVACVGITDFVSAAILKPFFARLRPCHCQQLEMYIRHLLRCGGYYGMPSSHASNHFGLACFWFYTIQYLQKTKWYWLWLWAFIICYAQVYVGKHYPFDMVAGAAFGLGVGYGMHRLFRLMGGVQKSMIIKNNVGGKNHFIHKKRFRVNRNGL